MIMKYLHSRRSCKPSVPVQETTAEKRSFLTHFFINAQSSLSSSIIRILFIFQFLSLLCSSINRFFRCFGTQPHPADPHPEPNRHPSMNYECRIACISFQYFFLSFPCPAASFRRGARTSLAFKAFLKSECARFFSSCTNYWKLT